MKEVRLGTPASCLGEEILLHSWLGNTYEKNCKTLSWCAVVACPWRTRTETTPVVGLEQRWSGRIQEGQTWHSGHHSAVPGESRAGVGWWEKRKVVATSVRVWGIGEGEWRKGRKLYCVLSILLQAWLQEQNGSSLLKSSRNQCCARQWRNARN